MLLLYERPRATSLRDVFYRGAFATRGSLAASRAFAIALAAPPTSRRRAARAPPEDKGRSPEENEAAVEDLMDFFTPSREELSESIEAYRARLLKELDAEDDWEDENEVDILY